MTLPFYLFAVVAGLLLAVFGWSLRILANRSRRPVDLTDFENIPRRQVSYFAQIQQALKDQDSNYLISRGSPKLARRLQMERREIALQYLTAIHRDFQTLLRMARMIAVLSPEVRALQEFERLRLIWLFAGRYRLAYLSLQFGRSPLPVLADLCHVVSGLSVRVDGAISDLGERAARVLEFGSTLEGRGLDHS